MWYSDLIYIYRFIRIRYKKKSHSCVLHRSLIIPTIIRWQIEWLLCSMYKFYLRFAIYKLPELRHGKTPVLHEGRGFYYMDQNNPSLVLSEKGMDETGHAVYNTLQQIYDNKV